MAQLPVWFAFADDARQPRPSRLGLASVQLHAYGGIVVRSDKLRTLKDALEYLANSAGLSRSDQFKWSPSKADLFRRSFDRDEQCAFFRRALEVAKSQECRAVVCVSAAPYATACVREEDHSLDALALFVERVDKLAEGSVGAHVTIASPGGGDRGRTELSRFLSQLRGKGTPYRNLTRCFDPLMQAHAAEDRALQLSDVIVSSTLARIAGESQYSPMVWESVRPLLVERDGRIAGAGMKLHPDFVLGNLYHWIGGDSQIVKSKRVINLPNKDWPLWRSAGEYSREGAAA